VGACTTADRIGRWFMPVTGDLRLGGKYQLEGNAGGEILSCEPPRRLRVTWVMGEGAASEVEVRLSPGDGAENVLEPAHTAVVDPASWTKYGPGASEAEAAAAVAETTAFCLPPLPQALRPDRAPPVAAVSFHSGARPT
jgi:uncharacterized protein YndB with AHSA1/START domain